MNDCKHSAQNKYYLRRQTRSFHNEREFFDCLGKYWYSLLRKTLPKGAGNTWTENEVDVKNERKITKKGGTVQNQNRIKSRKNTKEEHENFRWKGHWYERAAKNVKLPGRHYVGPKCNTGETLQACVTRQLLKSINSGSVTDALHNPLFSFGSTCTCHTSQVYQLLFMCYVCCAFIVSGKIHPSGTPNITQETLVAVLNYPLKYYLQNAVCKPTM